MGAALSHLRVAERAYAEHLTLQVVLEDDALLADEALPALLREVLYPLPHTPSQWFTPS